MLGVAVIGAGAVCSIHLDSFLEHAAICEVRAICDISEEKARTAIGNKGITAKVYTDVDEMLKDPDIDIVSICLPPDLHCDVTVKSLKAGKHVLVEKPMAPSLEECDIMIAAQKESGRILSVVSQNRYKVPTMKVKSMLDSGVAGDVKHAMVNSLWWRGENYHDLAWRGVWAKEGGGSVANQSVHHLDLAQWLLGMPERITAVMRNVAHNNSQCEDSAVAIFEYPDKLVQFTSNIVTHDEEQELVFQTAKGRISVPWQVAASQPLPNGFPTPNETVANELQAAYDNAPVIEKEGHPGMIGNFLHAILGDEPLMIDGTEGKKAVELIIAIYKAAATHQPVTLPMGKDDSFYTKEGMVSQMPIFHEKTHSVENMAAFEISFGRDVGK